MTRQMYDPETLQKVQEALCWAYRNGYSGAVEAAQELANHQGLKIEIMSLGGYGDTIAFVEQDKEGI